MKKLFLLSTAILSIASASYASMNQVKADEVPTVEQTDSNGKRVQVPATGYNSNEVRASNVRLLEIHNTPQTYKEMHSKVKHEMFERVLFPDKSFKSEFNAKYSNLLASNGTIIINDKYPVFHPTEYGLYEMDFDRGDDTAYRFKVDVRYDLRNYADVYLMNIEIVNTNSSDNSTSASDTNVSDNSASVPDTNNSVSASNTSSSASASNTSNSASASDTNNSTSTSDTNNSTSTSTSNSSANLGLSSTSASNSNTSTSTDILATSSWMYSNGRWWYKHANGSYTTKAWEKIDGVWYYFDDEGWMKTGWVKDGKWYYLSESGAMLTGWVKDNGAWYYLNQSGAMQTGWVKDNGTWYYLDGSGAMQTGWVKDGSWYYLDGSGAMQTGWVKDNDNWYYLQDSGAMKTGWMKVSDKWYYAYNSGALAINTTTPDGYYVDYNGEWV